MGIKRAFSLRNMGAAEATQCRERICIRASVSWSKWQRDFRVNTEWYVGWEFEESPDGWSTWEKEEGTGVSNIWGVWIGYKCYQQKRTSGLRLLINFLCIYFIYFCDFFRFTTLLVLISCPKPVRSGVCTIVLPRTWRQAKGISDRLMG